MTTTPTEDEILGSALATLWQRHRQTNLDRILLLEVTAANVLRGVADSEALAEGASAAHKLAGSLGTFGFDAGSRAAFEAESLLAEPVVDGRLLAEAVTALRSSVEDPGDAPVSEPELTMAISAPPGSGPEVQIVSSDADLISRLAVEAAAIGLVINAVPELPSVQALATGRPALIIVDEDSLRAWSRPNLLSSIDERARKAAIVILTDRDGFEDRVELAKAGVVGVIPRSQGSRETVSFLVEELARREHAQSTVSILTTDPQLLETLRGALAGPDCRLVDHHDPVAFWDAIEEQGTDLVIAECNGPNVSGPDLCRLIRAHPRWHRLPVIVVGAPAGAWLQKAMSAGADDYWTVDISPGDLRVRLRSHLEKSRLTQVRSDIDPLTGIGNQTSAERSLDRLLRLAGRQSMPFSLALIAVDQVEQIRKSEGSAVCDVVLHGLGNRLVDRFRGEDIVGRWSHDGFAVGMYGATSEQACERVRDVLQAFASEGFPTTSGRLARYSFSAGISFSPRDGSSLLSLERHAEAALGRAKADRNCVVVAGERPSGLSPSVYDVVLVEDDDSISDVIEYALRLRRYAFKRFSDGAEAASALGQGQVKGKVVLLDVGLPSLDGFGVLQVLRSEGVLDDTRVIMLTARSSEAEMLRALGLGAMEHITKPFSMAVLLGRLEQTRAREVA